MHVAFDIVLLSNAGLKPVNRAFEDDWVICIEHRIPVDVSLKHRLLWGLCDLFLEFGCLLTEDRRQGLLVRRLCPFDIFVDQAFSGRFAPLGSWWRVFSVSLSRSPIARRSLWLGRELLPLLLFRLLDNNVFNVILGVL